MQENDIQIQQHFSSFFDNKTYSAQIYYWNRAVVKADSGTDHVVSSTKRYSKLFIKSNKLEKLKLGTDKIKASFKFEEFLIPKRLRFGLIG